MARCKQSVKVIYPLALAPAKTKTAGTTWPDPQLTRTLLHCAVWLTFIYMLLLTLFEFIELLRPKPRRLRPPLPPTGPPACPVCGQHHEPPAPRNKRRRCVIL